jgi:hypothetical protein
MEHNQLIYHGSRNINHLLCKDYSMFAIAFLKPTFISCTVLTKTTLVECFFKSINTHIKAVILNIRCIIKFSNFIIVCKAFNNSIKNISGYLMWPAWPIRWPS